MSIKRFKGKPNILGDNLRKYRELRGYSQRDLSNKLSLLGIELRSEEICRIENYQLFLRDFEIIAICKVLNITLEQLFEESDTIFD